MDAVYSILEVVHIFIPAVAVVSCILILFLCGIRGSSQPPKEYLRKIEEQTSRPKMRPKALHTSHKEVPKSPSKLGSVTPSPSVQVAHEIGAKAARQEERAKSAIVAKEKKSRKDADEDYESDGWVTVQPRRRGKSGTVNSSDESMAKSPSSERAKQGEERREVTATDSPNKSKSAKGGTDPHKAEPSNNPADVDFASSDNIFNALPQEEVLFGKDSRKLLPKKKNKVPGNAAEPEPSQEAKEASPAVDEVFSKVEHRRRRIRREI